MQSYESIYFSICITKFRATSLGSQESVTRKPLQAYADMN